MSHITDEQVDKATKAYCARLCMRHALEAAFPEPPQAAFGKLVVSYEMAEKAMGAYESYPHNDCVRDLQQALQSFVDRHAIKPIAFADQKPEEKQAILTFCLADQRWYVSNFYSISSDTKRFPFWLPASVLPIPEPPVDPKEQSFKEFCKKFELYDESKALREHHDFIYEAAQREGK